MSKISVATAGDSRVAEEFGGTPGYVIEALNAVGATASGIDLRGSSIEKIHRLSWIAKQTVAHARFVRGWQWSEPAQLRRDTLFLRNHETEERVLSLFQCPPRTVPDEKLFFYIDGTLQQLFKSYPEASRVDNDIKSSALSREGDAYNRSRHIFVTGQSAANDLFNNYSVAEAKVTVLRPAPNMSSTQIPKLNRVSTETGKSISDPLVAVIVAKDFCRKGVANSIQFLDEMIDSGIHVRLIIIGLANKDIPARWRRSWIQALGTVAKSSNPGLFESILLEAHIGFLQSSAELAGLALLEYQKLGLLVVASGVGGMRDIAFTDHIHWVPPGNSSEWAAAQRWIQEAIRQGDLADEVHSAASQASRVPGWNDVAKELVLGMQ